ncbi:MAG: allophanate hydrolase [Opitutus sp.]|nr:allophanate hydrolase [Opitutus sp.]MCS6248382.1 allophanate hydrolase [Opitutus sp.]MCS6274918.1 allophanate hydrolase [Opitutus sp.]MCS6276509.1 allophanate hydrolase [Opitutus sp.]MCS6301843.1 allophanate hydrolase [Opitutus sp.]
MSVSSSSLSAESITTRLNDYAERDPAVWISRLSLAELRVQAEAANPKGALAGLTFAIKDNIDLAGVPTTAACPGFAYTPAKSAGVVEKLLAAGAVPVGKTNLDQFATGLVGVRSPYGAPRNVFNPDYISGGSSSGSAVAVAAGLVDFAIGTDTAGSGRVPAAFNGIIGLKPTRGRLSPRGVVPACRSLDCVSIFTRDLATAARVLTAAEGFDPADPFSRQPEKCHPLGDTLAAVRRLGVPRADQLEWFGNVESPGLFAAALDRLRGLGIEIVEVDFAPFLDAARLLYEGPWTAERFAAVGAFIENHLPANGAPLRADSATPAGLDPTVTSIIQSGKTASAADAFRASYRLAELRRAADVILASVDVLVAPTAGTIYTVAEVLADPVRLNSNLGRYNNFMNLLDLCGLTVPAARYSFGPGFGITFIAPAWHDARLLALGARFLGEAAPAECHLIGDTKGSAAVETVTLAVCGAHLKGQALHGQLTALGAQFLAATTTSAQYRLFALANTTPAKPGLMRLGGGEIGAPIEVETYALSPEAFGRFVAAVPAPMVTGTVQLGDGTWVKGFLCEPCALINAVDITVLGGWRAYLVRATADKA